MTTPSSADPHAPHPQDQGPYQLFMLALSVYGLAALGADTLLRLTPSTREILAYSDFVICVIFFIDFVVQLVRAPSRWGYFIRWGWLDLLSSIPMVDALRVGRAARVMRILRVLRGVRATRLLAAFVLERRAEAAFLAVSLLSLMLVVLASVAVLQFEQVEGANIRSAQDAMWWAVTTMTTVGYGDRYPVTGEGRFVAAVLMVTGVGLFGTFSGFVASKFLAPGEAAQTREMQEQEEERDRQTRELRAEIAALRQLLERHLATRAPSAE